MPVTDTADHNGPAIRDFRRVRGLSCADLAQRVGIHEQTLRNLELYDSITRPSSPKRCSPEVLERIAAALDVQTMSISRGSVRSAMESAA